MQESHFERQKNAIINSGESVVGQKKYPGTLLNNRLYRVYYHKFLQNVLTEYYGMPEIETHYKINLFNRF